MARSKEGGGRLSSARSSLFSFPNTGEVATGKMKSKDLCFLELGPFPKIKNDKGTGVEEVMFLLTMRIRNKLDLRANHAKLLDLCHSWQPDFMNIPSMI